MRFLLSTLLFILIGYSPLHAQVETPPPVAHYYVLKLTDAEPIDYEKPTHFFVADSGYKLVSLFQEAATGRLQRLKEVYPGHQFILIAYNESRWRPQFDNLSFLKRWGYEIIKEEYSYILNDLAMFREMKSFKKIHSLDIFSHANINGAVFSVYGGYSGSEINFVPTATISLFGCNAGYKLAGILSETFGIPVSASLTSSDFQKLHTLGDYFRNDEHLKPTTGQWSRSNDLSFNQPVSCSKGVCVRMKPDEFPYTGMHGAYPYGLPYYKFFCPGLTEERCLQAKSQWILGFLSLKPLHIRSSYEDYKLVVRDVLCPNNYRTNVKAECTQKLIESESDPLVVYSPFKGNMIQCDWQGCDFTVTSKTSFIDEYHSFLRAYQYLILSQ